MTRWLCIAALGAAAACRPSAAFDDATLAALRQAFTAYDRVRERLAADTVDGLGALAAELDAALAAAAAAAPAGAPHAAIVAAARRHTAALGAAATLEAARRELGGVSRQLLELAARDPRLTEGWAVYRCPMAEGYATWLEPPGPIENPYMGGAMLHCGVAEPWPGAAAGPASAPGPADPAVAYFTCPMHPSVRQATAGRCPLCGMDLTPVSQADAASGTIVLDEARRRRIGVATAPAAVLPLTLRLEALGEVRPDETRLTDVSLRTSGWVQKLFVDVTGQEVRPGQTLLTLYSPEVYAAELEHLGAIRRRAAGATGFGDLEAASRKKLRLLGIPEAHIHELEARGEASEHVPIVAAAGGFVIDKQVVEGARVEAGALLYRLADLRQVWVEAHVYEADLPHVRVGQAARIVLPFVADAAVAATIEAVYPTLDASTRTGKVRVVLANPSLALKPAMYATVEIAVELGERLAIPESAVLYTGRRRLVFVDLGGGRLRPQEIELGAHAGDLYEVKRGLAPGDVVVTSGNFLVAAESRLRSAVEAWGADHGGP